MVLYGWALNRDNFLDKEQAVPHKEEVEDMTETFENRTSETEGDVSDGSDMKKVR